MRQAGLDGNGLGSRFEFAVAQGGQQVVHEDDALATALDEPLIDQEFGALLRRIALAGPLLANAKQGSCGEIFSNSARPNL